MRAETRSPPSHQGGFGGSTVTELFFLVLFVVVVTPVVDVLTRWGWLASAAVPVAYVIAAAAGIRILESRKAPWAWNAAQVAVLIHLNVVFWTPVVILLGAGLLWIWLMIRG